MTTRIATLMLFCLCSAASADLDIQEITPANARELGWTIEANPRKDYAQYTVQPPAHTVTQKRDAHLSVRDDSKMISTSLLGVQEFRGAKRFVFAVSHQYVKDSVFELGTNSDSRRDTKTSFRIKLYKFVVPMKQETSAPN